MTDMYSYLVLGSYAFTAGSYVWSWLILRALQRIDQKLAYQKGLDLGQSHEARIARLERGEAFHDLAN